MDEFKNHHVDLIPKPTFYIELEHVLNMASIDYNCYTDMMRIAEDIQSGYINYHTSMSTWHLPGLRQALFDQYPSCYIDEHMKRTVIRESLMQVN